MKKDEILSIIQKSKFFNLEEYDNFRAILEFLQNFENNFRKLLNKYENSVVRFCDYYEENFTFNELTNYFKDNYKGEDKNEQYNFFIMFSIFRKCQFLIEALITFDQSDTLELFGDDIENICNLIQEFLNLNMLREKTDSDSDLDFDNHKYKLLFSGFSLDDIISLDKRIIKALVNKINNLLLDLDMVPGAERVGHVSDKFNIPLFRVQLADDFRIAFMRKNGVTIILGIEFKTGKDMNYNRYDIIARKIDAIYWQCDLLIKNELPSEDNHYKALEEIRNRLKNNRKKI